MQTIKFRVYGEPKGQPRARATVRGKHAAVYKPKTDAGWCEQVAIAAKPKLQREPITAPVNLCIDFLMPRPKGHYGTGRNADKLKASAPRLHVSKPDLDNLIKGVKDELTQIGLWRDDSLVYAEAASKRYVGPGERPGCVVMVEVAGVT